MLKGLSILLASLWAGAILSDAVGNAIPAAILGMLLLLALLLILGMPPELEKTSLRLLGFMPLCILPASAGIVDYGPLLRSEWFALSLALVISVCVSFWTTPLIFRYMCRLLLRHR